MQIIPRRIWRRATLLSALAFVSPLIVGQPAFAQKFFWESVRVLPGNSTRVDYLDLKALRAMPHYASLRGSYAGGPLRDLEAWLGPFGLRQEDITELLLGREGGKNGKHIFAIAGGKFNLTSPTEESSPGSRFVPTKIGELTGYCLGPVSDRQACALFKGENWGALGRREFLTYVVEGGDSVTEPLSSDPKFMDLAATIPSDAPLWGILRGAEAVNWLKADIPYGDSVPIIWSTTLEGLDGLTYSVTPGEEQVRVAVNLEYKTSSGASSLGAVLQGVKAIEGVLWQTIHPGGSDPFSDAEVSVDGVTVSFTLSVSYQVLESGVVLGPAHGP